MEQKKTISHQIAGLFIACLLVLFSVIMYLLGFGQFGGTSMVSLLLLFVGIITFVNIHGNDLKNQVGFSQLFGYGFKTTAIVALVIILFTILFILLFPEIKEKSFDKAREEMSKGDLTEDEIERNIELGRRMFWVFAIGSILLIYAIVGAIGSLIGAAITKKQKINSLD